MSGTNVLRWSFPPYPALSILARPFAYVVGRSSKCDIVIDHPSVSRRHAEIRVTHKGVLVLDLGSLNGTCVDDEPVHQRQVIPGQKLRFGDVTVVLASTREDTNDHNNGPSSATPTAFPLEHGNSGHTQAGVEFNVKLLSPAQQRILEFLLSGLPEKQIAANLDLSPHTVHNHIRAIFSTIGVHSRAELMALLLAGSTSRKS
jgi:pSer/pThr/pTyr-binding forkhead associated (FHA) protein